MGRMSRDKGKRGERELFGLLSDLLGTVVRRNINARRGDPDSLELDGWACEVKRCESWLEVYWSQACEQAERIGRRPVLFFRQTRKPWVAIVDFADVCNLEIQTGRYRAELTLEAFAAYVREELATREIAGQPLKTETTFGVDRANGSLHELPRPTAAAAETN
jgi:hypothetical protein